MNILIGTEKTADLGRITNYLEKTIFYLKSGSYTMPFSIIDDRLNNISTSLATKGLVQPEEEVQSQEAEVQPEEEVIGEFSYPLYRENGDSLVPHEEYHVTGQPPRGRRVLWNCPEYMEEFMITA